MNLNIAESFSQESEYLKLFNGGNYTNIFLDEKFIYVVRNVNGPYNSNLIIFDHKYQRISNLNFEKEIIQKVIPSTDGVLIISSGPWTKRKLEACDSFLCKLKRVFLITHHEKQISKEYWRGEHKLRHCTLAEKCKILRKGDFGIFDAISYNDGILLSEYKWEDRIATREGGVLGPSFSRVVYLENNNASKIKIGKYGGVLGFSNANNGKIYILLYDTNHIPLDEFRNNYEKYKHIDTHFREDDGLYYFVNDLIVEIPKRNQIHFTM